MTEKEESTNGAKPALKLLGREEILKAEDFRVKDVPVPEWGGTVRVRSLTGDQRDAFEAQIREIKRDGSIRPNPTKVRAKLLALTIVDERNKRLFSQEDVISLGKKSAAAIERVYMAAAELSGMRIEDVEDAKADLESDPSDGPTSAGQ